MSLGGSEYVWKGVSRKRKGVSPGGSEGGVRQEVSVVGRESWRDGANIGQKEKKIWKGVKESRRE